MLGEVARYTLYPTTPEEVLASQRNNTECGVGGGGEETPWPLSVTTVGEFVALLLTFTLPLISSAFFGANVTSNVVVCPGASVA